MKLTPFLKTQALSLINETDPFFNETDPFLTPFRPPQSRRVVGPLTFHLGSANFPVMTSLRYIGSDMIPVHAGQCRPLSDF
jgi:hypothetical protein